jgi:hypothetical protein
MLLDIVRWEIIKLATLRAAPDGTRLRACALRLLTSMLVHARDQDWVDNRELVT